MPFPALIPFLAMAYGGKRIQDRDEERNRGLLQQGINEALGRVPTVLDPSSTAPGMITGEGLDPGAGLLKDPTDIVNQLRFAANVIGLPAGGKQIGANLIGQALGFGEAEQAQQLNFGQRNFEQQNDFAFRQAEAETDRAFRADQARLDREQRKQISAEAIAGVRQGSVPSGAYEVQTSQGPVTVYQPGTTQYNDAQTELGLYEQAVTDIDDMIELVRENGDEQIGPRSGEMGILYGNIMAHIANLRNLGVIQKDEAERLESQLVDPTSLSAMLNNEDTIIAQYETLLRQFQGKLGIANRKYSLWGLGSELQGSTPRQIREQQEEQRRLDSLPPGATPIRGAPPEPPPLLRRPQQTAQDLEAISMPQFGDPGERELMRQILNLYGGQ